MYIFKLYNYFLTRKSKYDPLSDETNIFHLLHLNATKHWIHHSPFVLKLIKPFLVFKNNPYLTTNDISTGLIFQSSGTILFRKIIQLFLFIVLLSFTKLLLFCPAENSICLYKLTVDLLFEDIGSMFKQIFSQSHSSHCNACCDQISYLVSNSESDTTQHNTIIIFLLFNGKHWTNINLHCFIIAGLSWLITVIPFDVYHSFCITPY